MRARVLLAGAAQGPTLRLEEPLSFWGGLDPGTGCIVDRHHPQLGACLAGTVVVLERTRGSTSTAGVLAEAVRAGRGPAAIVLGEADVAVVMGLVAARELYGAVVPVVVLDRAALADVPSGRSARVTEDGELVLD